jgi:BirA family biotin operon repressor/biotin-[acetyl-CoA-carboxylase] ligase
MPEERRSRRTHPKKRMTDVARKLRRNSTEAEERLWYYLRDRRFYGFKFRRQRPTGRNVADLVCEQARLVIEVDGGQHADSPTDGLRTAFLNDSGYLVLRFWNNDVLSNTDGVLEEVAQRLRLSSEF